MSSDDYTECDSISVRYDRENGVVLVIVLWVLVLLGIIVSTYLATIRTDAAIVDNWISNAKARWAVNSGVQLGIMKALDKSSGRWIASEEEHVLNIDGFRLLVRVADEAGKVDINVASGELLQALFRSAGASDSTARGLVAEIMRNRMFAAQSLEKNTGSNSGQSRFSNGNYYQSIEQLTELELMRPEIMAAISSMVTVHSRMNGVNPEVAGLDVLSILPGISSSQVEEFIAKRKDANTRDDRLLASVKPGYIHGTRGLMLNVVVEAFLQNVSRGKATVIVSLDHRRSRSKNRHKKPYTIIEWNEPYTVKERATVDNEEH